jgi:hypothetical protein
MSLFSFLDRDHSIARPGYSRWLVPPAALAIHLAIGQVYAFSVFVNPLLAYGPNWSHKEVGYIFSLAIAILGISAALFGRWLETAGPRKAMFVAAPWISGRCPGRASPLAGADLRRLRRHWRCGTWPWLHLARFNARAAGYLLPTQHGRDPGGFVCAWRARY